MKLLVPRTLKAVILRALAESAGSVPARYSCRFVKPSPSSSLAASAGSFGLRPWASSHASGIPSPSVSLGMNSKRSIMISASCPFAGAFVHPLMSHKFQSTFSSQLGGTSRVKVHCAMLRVSGVTAAETLSHQMDPLMPAWPTCNNWTRTVVVPAGAIAVTWKYCQASCWVVGSKCCDSLTCSWLLPASRKINCATPYPPVCVIGSPVQLNANPVVRQVWPGLALRFWNAPEEPGVALNGPNIFREYVPARAMKGDAMSLVELRKTEPNCVQLLAVDPVPSSKPGLSNALVGTATTAVVPVVQRKLIALVCQFMEGMELVANGGMR